jgi:hypothetical protein
LWLEAGLRLSRGEGALGFRNSSGEEVLAERFERLRKGEAGLTSR